MALIGCMAVQPGFTVWIKLISDRSSPSQGLLHIAYSMRQWS